MLAFLEGGGLGAEIERIDTHAAIVLLAGDRAFKLKRPVRYSFLDFTTLERREAALRHELELNRRTAPELYLRVLPVTRGARRPRPRRRRRAGRMAARDAPLSGRGPARPRRRRRRPVRRLVDALAETVAAAHADGGAARGQGRPRRHARGRRGQPRRPRRRRAGRVRGRCRARPRRRHHGRRRHATARSWSTAVPPGLVRHCHGDLHLANIVLLDGRPVLFDCIEFDDDFACIDVLYDLAFLLMDLLEKGHRRPRHRLLNGWLERTGDHAGLALLPLFLSLRAAIRAKVMGLAVLQRAPDADHAEPRRYLDLAARFLAPAAARPRRHRRRLRHRQDHARPAPGARPAGPAPGAVVLRSDVIRKELFGRPPPSACRPRPTRPRSPPASSRPSPSVPPPASPPATR